MNSEPSGPWNEPAFKQLQNRDPSWAESCLKMRTNPRASGLLSRKLTDLVVVSFVVSSNIWWELRTLTNAWLCGLPPIQLKPSRFNTRFAG